MKKNFFKLMALAAMFCLSANHVQAQVVDNGVGVEQVDPAVAKAQKKAAAEMAKQQKQLEKAEKEAKKQAKQAEKAAAKVDAYETIHDLLMDILSDKPMTVAEIFTAGEGDWPEGTTKNKISYGLTHYWADEVVKIEGKPNQYRRK